MLKLRDTTPAVQCHCQTRTRANYVIIAHYHRHKCTQQVETLGTSILVSPLLYSLVRPVTPSPGIDLLDAEFRHSGSNHIGVGRIDKCGGP